MDYKQSGVDIAAGEELVKRIKPAVRQTFTPGVLSELGAFGGFFEVDFSAYRNAVLVSSVDGVGTKLKLAADMGIYNTIGNCLVNHCTNDILVCGAKPLFFLDYYATGKLAVDEAEQVIYGLVDGCKENNCALIGGETAEMPGLYQGSDFDIAGTIVGIVDKHKIVNGKNINPGDVLLGLGSNGLHTNGYSLARKIFEGRFNETFTGLNGTIGQELLKVHRSYLNLIHPMLEWADIKGLAHITGGGLVSNTMRVLPEGLGLNIDWQAWELPAVFELIQKEGDVPIEDMQRTFNMGIGLVIIISKDNVKRIEQHFNSLGEPCYHIGEVVML